MSERDFSDPETEVLYGYTNINGDFVKRMRKIKNRKRGWKVRDPEYKAWLDAQAGLKKLKEQPEPVVEEPEVEVEAEVVEYSEEDLRSLTAAQLKALPEVQALEEVPFRAVDIVEAVLEARGAGEATEESDDE